MACAVQMITAILALQQLPLALAYNLDDLAVMRNSIHNLILDDCRRIAAYVRLGFHDAVGDNGVDGCINVALNANNGLENHINELSNTLAGLPLQGVSKADFFAVAAVQAAYFSTSPCAEDCPPRPRRGKKRRKRQTPPTVDECPPHTSISTTLKFRTGRADCSVNNNVAESFPEPRWGFAEVTAYFSQMFGFDAECTVAIMGAHSLGRAREQNSGFDGPWVRDVNVLNSIFYREIKRRWVQSDTSVPLDPNGTPQHYWRRPQNLNGGRMMFNSDLCVARDLSMADTSNGDVSADTSCEDDSRTCGDSAGLVFAEQFEVDNPGFLLKFGACFDHMLTYPLSFPEPTA